MNCSAYSAVFTWTNLLVVVVELEGGENEALDLVPLVTNAVLEEHYLIVGVVVVETTAHPESSNKAGLPRTKRDSSFWRTTMASL